MKVVQTLELFPERMPVRFLCSKNSESRGIIRSAIGSESAVSQAPTEQSINLCKRLLQTLSGNSPCGKNVRGRFLHVGKSLLQVFEICRRIRTKMILKGISGKNLGKNNDSEKNAASENQFVVFMRVTLR